MSVGSQADATVVLSSDQVTKKFGSFTAVNQVSIHVEAGEVVGLLGANGAGKTTLLRMLLGLLKPTDGNVAMLGGPPDRDHRRRVGYVAQGLGLYGDLTVTENLAFVASAFGHPTPTLPDELTPYRDTLVEALPLGAARKVAFVAALSHQPEALLLDEPTSGVDALSRAELWDAIREQSEAGVGVLVTTHYMQEAQQCDRLLLLSAGQLVSQGSEADIIGGLTAVAVDTTDWAKAFEALNDAGIAVMLNGRAVRAVGTSSEVIAQTLKAAGVTASTSEVPATLEERMLVISLKQDAAHQAA